MNWLTKHLPRPFGGWRFRAKLWYYGKRGRIESVWIEDEDGTRTRVAGQGRD